MIAATALAAALLGAAGYRLATSEIGQGSLLASLARFGELYANSWDDLGFLSVAGVPLVLNFGETAIERHPYAHMPPAGWWPPYFGRALLGKTPEGLKLFSVLFAMTGLGILALLTARTAGPGYGVLATLLALAMPAVQLYAGLPGVESVSLLLAALFLAAWERAGRRPTRANSLLFLAGCLVAWPFYFVAPGLLLASIASPGGRREWRRVLPLFPLGVLGFLLVVLHLWIGTGDLSFVIDDLAETVRNTAGDGLFGDPDAIGARADFIGSLIPMATRNLGTATAILSGLAVLLVLLLPRARRHPATRIAIVAATVGVLNVVLFNGRSATHGYYYFILSAGTAFLLAAGSRALAELLASRGMKPRTAHGLAAGIVLAASGLGVAESLDGIRLAERPGLRELARTVDALVPPERAILCHSDQILDAVLFAERRFLPPDPRAEWLDRILDAIDARRVPYRGLTVVIDAGTAAAFPGYLARLEALADTRPGASRLDSPLGPVFLL